MKTLLIGCGNTARPYAAAIGSHPRMRLSAVVDTNPEAARDFGNTFECPYYVSLSEFLSHNDSIDCSVICTPSASNPDIASRLMQRGSSILCANPLALDYASAEKISSVSRVLGVQLMTGSLFRYIPDVMQARGLVQSGVLGYVLTFEIDFRNLVDPHADPESKPAKGNQGILKKGCIHAVDIARYFFGPLLRIRVEEAPRIRNQNVEDAVRIDMRTTADIIGTALMSWTPNNAYKDYVQIYGTKGTLCIGWKKSMYRLNGDKKWTPFGEGYNAREAVTRQMENLVDAMAGNGIPETTAEDGCESVRALEAAYKSLSTGEWVSLQPEIVTPNPMQVTRNFVVVSSRNIPSTNV